jgi:serine/threonine protein kinase
MLGKGSFGEVFLVRKKNEPFGKLYAMKVLSKDKVATKNLQRYAIT